MAGVPLSAQPSMPHRHVYGCSDAQNARKCYLIKKAVIYSIVSYYVEAVLASQGEIALCARVGAL